MKVTLVGDSCSGKTTVLTMLEKRGYPVAHEDGWQRIPKEVEAVRLQGIMWFTRYFFDRDRKLHGKTAILEHCLHSQYPLIYAQFRTGKMTAEQRDEALMLLDTFASAVPLEPDTAVIHLTCPTERIAQRLEARGRPQDAGQARYRDILRELTERYFQPRCMYRKIDTTSKSPEEICAAIIDILSQEEVSLRL